MKYRLFVAAVLGALPLLAAAQAYRCNSNGQAYLSDRPCPNTYSSNGNPHNGQSPANLKIYGPAYTPPQYTPRLYDPPKAQDHVQYLSSACSSISEAIRTGPSRGVKSDVMQGLHEEYRRKCALEDHDARVKAYGERMAEQQGKLAERRADAGERQQAKERMERCNGMRDVIALKRKREKELNPKEVEALRSLEGTYNEVCIAR